MGQACQGGGQAGQMARPAQSLKHIGYEQASGHAHEQTQERPAKGMPERGQRKRGFCGKRLNWHGFAVLRFTLRRLGFVAGILGQVAPTGLGAGQNVATLVFGVAGVALEPVEGHLVLLQER